MNAPRMFHCHDHIQMYHHEGSRRTDVLVLKEKLKYLSVQRSAIYEKALLLEDSQASPVCPSSKSNSQMKVGLGALME